MGDALFHRGQRHIVAVSTLQVVLVAGHSLIKLSFKFYVNGRRDVIGGEASFYLWASLRHIADGVGGCLKHDQLADHFINERNRKGEIFVTIIC